MAENVGGLAAAAGAGNLAITGAFDDIMKNYKVPMPPSPEERKSALGAYTDALKAPADTREDWQVLLNGRMAAQNPFDPLEASIAAMQHKAVWDKTQRESVKKGNELAAKAQYEDLLARQKTFDAEFNPMLKASQRSALGGVGGVVTRQLPNGTVVVLNKATGEEVRRITPEESRDFNQLFQKFLTIGAERGEYSSLDELKSWANSMAVEALGASRAAVGNKSPVPGAPNAAQSPQPAVQPPVALNIDGAEAPASALPPEAQDEVRRLTSRLETNGSPELQAATIKRLKELATQYGAPAPVSTTLPKKNVQLEEEKKGYGSTTGKHMADTAIDLQKTGAAAQSLIGDLNVLEQLYSKHGDAIPEGEQGDLIAKIKSSMKSFGVEVEGAGVTDVVSAIAKKQALKTRTADGENLLPGAMSNYEDRLLQSMSPGLLMTQEGRLIFLQVAKAQLKMRTELSAAAREYIRNVGRLDSGWFDVAAKYAEANPFLNPKKIEALEEYGRRLSKGVK